MANQPSLIPSAWAASNTAVNPIPATTSQTGKASWAQGFPIETSKPLTQGGVPPQYGDFNGILKVLSEFALYAQSGGQYAWVNSLDYNAGAVVVGSDGYLYRAAQASGPSTTAVNPVGDVSGTWEKIVSQSDLNAITSSLGNVTSTANDAYANASAANLAVTTLDANVVKLSGSQTVGGAKTYTASAVFSSGATFSSGITVSSGATIDSATITNATVTNGATISGGMTVDGKGLVYDSGAQTISGIKTWATDNEGVNVSNTAQTHEIGLRVSTAGNAGLWDVTKSMWAFGISSSGNIFMCARDGNDPVKTLSLNGDGFLSWDGANIRSKNKNYDITVTPSTTQFNSFSFSDKNDEAFAGVTTYQNTADSRGMMFRIRAKNESNVSNFLQGSKDASGTILVACYGTTRPSANNSITLGDATYRWKQLYANTSTINTSDERQKTSISVVPDAILEAWGEVSWSQFQFKDAVEEKGADKARLHNGLIAQRIDEVFKAHGLDASRYGLFCWDSWETTPEERDEQGNITQEARPAGDAYSLRYEEALCMEAAYQRRRADRAEARITSIEQRLNEMEAMLASMIAPVGDETYAEPEQDVEQEGGDEN